MGCTHRFKPLVDHGLIFSCGSNTPNAGSASQGLQIVNSAHRVLIEIRERSFLESCGQQCCVSEGDTNGAAPLQRDSFLPEANTQRIQPTTLLPVNPRQ